MIGLLRRNRKMAGQCTVNSTSIYHSGYSFEHWGTSLKTKCLALTGLNGDILVWNPITKRRHELSSMGIRVNADTLRSQLEQTGQTDFLNYPYHKAILNNEVPLAIGGGIGQSRVYSLLLQKAHIGEVSVAVWPKKLKEICENRNIHVLY